MNDSFLSYKEVRWSEVERPREPLKLLVNCTNLSVGGGVQVAVSFIQELAIREKRGEEVTVIASPPVYRQIDERCRAGVSRFVECDFSPAHPLRGWRSRRLLRRIESEVEPDVVFSVFGPTYWRPRATHIVGFANPWVINPGTDAYRKLTLGARWKAKLKYRLYGASFNREADILVGETDAVREGIVGELGWPRRLVHVVSNTCSAYFLESSKGGAAADVRKRQSEFVVLCITHDYPHKNLDVLGEVGARLAERGVHVRFIVTMRPEDFRRKGRLFQSYCSNVGTVALRDCPTLYASSDAVILPSLLECFSANYPEAMAMRKPIVTSDRDFARAVCRSAALYFDPWNPRDIAEKLQRVLLDQELRESLVKEGLRVLKSFPTASQRASSYLELCSAYARRNAIAHCE